MSSVLTQLQRRVEPALPGRDYHDSGVFELERRRIFHRKWFCVGREEQAPLRGDFFVIDVIDESILVVRGDDLVLRAFYNVCRHRGSELGEGTGQFKSVIKCPYHSWCYALDGRLVGTPNVGRDEGLDRQSYGLHPVALETWEGFVFVNLGNRIRQPPSLAAGRDRRTSVLRALPDGGADGRPPHRVRRASQLEDPHRQLQRMPALPGHSP